MIAIRLPANAPDRVVPWSNVMTPETMTPATVIGAVTVLPGAKPP